MSTPKKVSYDERVCRGEGTNYIVDNYITGELSQKVSLAISHLRGELWGTKNIESDRVYYFIEGSGHFSFDDNSKIDVVKGDVLLIPANIGYKMNGHFDAVLVNSPAFDIKNEVEV